MYREDRGKKEELQTHTHTHTYTPPPKKPITFSKLVIFV